MFEPWVIYLMVGIGLAVACCDALPVIPGETTLWGLAWVFLLVIVFWPMVAAYWCGLALIRTGQRPDGAERSEK